MKEKKRGAEGVKVNDEKWERAGDRSGERRRRIERRLCSSGLTRRRVASKHPYSVLQYVRCSPDKTVVLVLLFTVRNEAAKTKQPA